VEAASVKPPPAPAGARGSRFIFVGGAPRSGTTLVQNMLDCHPEVLGGPEFLHLGRIVELRSQLQRGIDRGAIDAFCSRSEADRLIARLIEDLLLPFADRHGAPFLSEKTPSNVFVFRELVELFPGSRCLFVLRDPRAVVASMLETGRRAAERGRRAQPWTRDLDAAIGYVRRCLEAAFDAADALPERLHIVRYEALVTDPEAETRAICAFLGLAWSPAMLTPAARAHPGEAAITRTGVWYDQDSVRRDPDPEGIDRWRDRLDARQRGAITLAFAAMPRLGAFYPLEGSLTGRERALGLAARAVGRARARLGRALRSA
jgi:hypothetical protein